MRKINRKSYSHLLDIQGNTVFAANGNVILCYKVHPPEIYSLSEKDLVQIHATWFHGLKNLPIGTVIHKQDVYIKTTYKANDLPDSTFLQQATHHHFKDRGHIEHQSYVFFIWPQNKALNNPKYINPFKKFTLGDAQKLEESSRDFVKDIGDTVGYINSGKKIELLAMDTSEILTLSDHYFNGFNQDVDTDILLNDNNNGAKSSITIGSNHFDILAVNSELCFGQTLQTSLPSERFTSNEFKFHQGFIDGLGLCLKENHIVNQIIYLDDTLKWRKILEHKIEELSKSSNFGSQNKVVLKKVEAVLEQINADADSRVIRGHINVIFWNRERDTLKKIESKIIGEFKKLDIVPYYPRCEERKNYFLNSYFCFASNFSKEDLYVTDLKHSLCLLINSTNYKSDTTGIIFNEREHNIPVLKDVWDENKRRIKARNFAIFAPTGEGKSFLANSILRQYFEQGIRLVIIDLGGSYTKFAKLYPKDSTVLRYEMGKNLGINPFYIECSNDLTPDRLEDLSIFIFELLGSDFKVIKAETVSLKKILLHYYTTAPDQMQSLEGFYLFVKNHQNTLLETLSIHPTYFNLTHFLHILSEYVHPGIYSYLFEAGEDQSYLLEHKRIIVFELDQVRDHREILSVMLKLIKSAIDRTIWKNRAERGIILFDEFAKQLKFTNVLESVEYYYQAIRKQNGAIGIILQSISQLPVSPISFSILENTQVLYSLYNEKGYDELASRLKLSNHDLNQLRSIRNNLAGGLKYTEVFLKIGKQSNIFRLEVPAEVHAAYLSEGPENEIIMDLYEKHGDMEQAILHYVQNLKS